MKTARWASISPVVVTNSWFDGVYHSQNSEPEFHGVRSPTAEQLQTLLGQIIQCIMKALTRHGALIEEEGMTYFADMEADTAPGATAIGGLHLSDCSETESRAKGINAKDTLSGWHDAYCYVAVRIHAASDRIGSPAKIEPYPLS